jgi:hypothetical protein
MAIRAKNGDATQPSVSLTIPAGSQEQEQKQQQKQKQEIKVKCVFRDRRAGRKKAGVWGRSPQGGGFCFCSCICIFASRRLRENRWRSPSSRHLARAAIPVQVSTLRPLSGLHIDFPVHSRWTVKLDSCAFCNDSVTNAPRQSVYARRGMPRCVLSSKTDRGPVAQGQAVRARA